MCVLLTSFELIKQSCSITQGLLSATGPLEAFTAGAFITVCTQRGLTMFELIKVSDKLQ